MDQPPASAPPSPRRARPRRRRPGPGAVTTALTILVPLSAMSIVIYLIGGGGPQPAGPTSMPMAAPGAITVTIRNYGFYPSSVVVQPGQVVIWVNKDVPLHTVTSAGNAWTSATLLPGGRFEVRLTRPGVYHYSCLIHPVMLGTLLVSAAGTMAAPATGSLAGVVTAAGTGRPLPHVLIRAGDTHSGQVTVTDSQGLYILDGLTVGRPVTVSGCASGYTYYRGQRLYPRRGVAMRYSFALAPRPGNHKGCPYSLSIPG